MNIHLPAILGFTRYQGFDPSPIYSRVKPCTIDLETQTDEGLKHDLILIKSGIHSPPSFPGWFVVFHINTVIRNPYGPPNLWTIIYIYIIYIYITYIIHTHIYIYTCMHPCIHTYIIHACIWMNTSQRHNTCIYSYTGWYRYVYLPQMLVNLLINKATSGATPWQLPPRTFWRPTNNRTAETRRGGPACQGLCRDGRQRQGRCGWAQRWVEHQELGEAQGGAS